MISFSPATSILVHPAAIGWSAAVGRSRGQRTCYHAPDRQQRQREQPDEAAAKMGHHRGDEVVLLRPVTADARDALDVDRRDDLFWSTSWPVGGIFLICHGSAPYMFC